MSGSPRGARQLAELLIVRYLHGWATRAYTAPPSMRMQRNRFRVLEVFLIWAFYPQVTVCRLVNDAEFSKTANSCFEIREKNI